MSTHKKIGILFGKERSFPMAFIEAVNRRNSAGITAEPIRIDKVVQGDADDYAVIIDRISQDVPFYRAYLKNAALSGTAVINNPFWWSADEKFFNNCLAVKNGIPVPKTVLLPSRELPTDTSDQSFSNLVFPLDWPSIFNYVGFPAYMKPFAGGGWKNVYKLYDAEDFYRKHSETGQLVMLLQEEIVVRINAVLGYDFNTVELAVRDGIPYAIDFCNPAPDAEKTSVGEENFNWVVETAADYAIERALAHREGADNLTWGEYLRHSAVSRG